jgi:dTDP-4-amino-4,6-dideoxygalactose transaminase
MESPVADIAPASAADPLTAAGVPLIDLKAQYRTIAGEIREAVDAVFTEQLFVLGDEVASLECEIAEHCDSLHAVGCGSGTDALVLSLLALNIGEGDEVITSPFTFFATASTIQRVGAKPVFVDIDPVSFNLDPDRVEAAVTPRTRAIIPVHLFGQCAEMEPLFRVAVRKRLVVIEDACQAIGAEYHGRRAGVLGTMACFSFFPTKNLGGAGDGGMITTDDAELAAKLRRLRVHGDAGGYNHQEIGLCSRLDALQAAVLRVKLRHLDDWTNARGENARRYRELFRHYELLDAVELPETLPGRRHVYNQFCVRVRGGLRDQVLSSLRTNNIGAAVYYPKPLHLQPAFRHLGLGPGSFPESEAASGEVLALPIFPELQPVQQELVVRGIAAALGRLGSRAPADGPATLSLPQTPHRRAA